MGVWDVRQALEPCFEFVSKEMHILQDILVRPLARCEVLHEWEELGNQHRWQIGRWRFRDEVLKHPQSMSAKWLLDTTRKLTRSVAILTRTIFSLAAACATLIKRGMTSYFLHIF